MTNKRSRNLALATALGVAAAALTMTYVSRAESGTKQAAAETASVFVATRDIAIGTPGGKAVASGQVEARQVPATAVATGAVTDAAQIATLVAAQPIYKGEQVTTRRFRAASAAGLRTELRKDMRVLQIAGDRNQLLVGILSAGDRVDVVASFKSDGSQNGGEWPQGRTVLRNLLVLRAPAAASDGNVGGDATHAVTLQVSDRQAQRLFFVSKNAEWSLVLRPTVQPTQTPVPVERVSSVIGEAR